MDNEQIEIVENLKNIYPFNKLDMNTLEEISNILQIKNYLNGESVFDVSDPANDLYFLLEGNVKLIGPHDDDGKEVILNGKTVFGFEICLDEPYRMSQAKVINTASIIIINRDVIRGIIKKAPAFGAALEILAKSYTLSTRVKLPWKKNNEHVIYIDRRHILLMWKKQLLPILFLLAIFVVGLYQFYSNAFPEINVKALFIAGIIFISLWSLLNFLSWYNDYVIVTDKRVLKQKILLPLHESRQEALMNMVLSVGVGTGLVSRWFNYGDIIIRTYAGKLMLSGLRYPQEVSLLIQAEWFRVKGETYGGEEISTKEKIIKARLGMDPDNVELNADRIVEKNLIDDATHVKNGLLDIIARLLQIRIDTGKEIVYRTHWFLAIKKVFLPSVLLLVVQYFLSLKLAGGNIINIDTKILVILSIIVDFVLIIWWIYCYIDWRNDLYQLTDEFLVDVYKKPLGREERKSAPLRNIQSIEFERHGIIGLVLNYGTVHIIVGESELTFDNVYNPSDVQKDIFNRVFKREELKGIKNTQMQEKQMGDWIEAYHRAMNDKNQEI